MLQEAKDLQKNAVSKLVQVLASGKKKSLLKLQLAAVKLT